MKIVFFGTGAFGLPTLKSLLDSSHEVALVVTQPDRKKGRGQNVMPAPVKAYIEKRVPGMDVLQAESTRDASFLDILKGVAADVFVVVDYGRLLQKEILDMPGKCCVNLHPSLLPKYRGAAPVNWALFHGEKETGNTIIKMTVGIGKNADFY